MNKRKILILIGTYLPGQRAGGPVQTIKNLTDRLGEEYDFYILTADRDLGCDTPYEGIVYGQWNQVGKAKVRYVPEGRFTQANILEASQGADIIYICICFNSYARIAMRLKKQGRIGGKIVIAAMGLFSPGAFHIKYVKKKLYMELLKACGYFKLVEWSVTSEKEKTDVKRVVGRKAVCRIAEDIPRCMQRIPEPAIKDARGLRIIFLSRISPEKNLDYALDVLKNVKAKIIFDIYGVNEDKRYFDVCMSKAKNLPGHIQCSYKGAVMPDKVIEIFSGYHVFLFPTLGENFGHVIYEAMAGGCIPIISNRTPWQRISDDQIAWGLPLEEPDRFVQAIQCIADMSAAECSAAQLRAAQFAWEYAQKLDDSGYRAIFG